MNITISHAKGSYDVDFINTKSVSASLRPDDLIVTDTNVKSALKIDRDCFAIVPGESSKNISVYNELLEWLANRGNRQSRVVAIGGGVVGDIAGFAAATFMRGVAFVQIPTSLMAMVDSAVGGKVGVDLRAGKNLAGAFWQPQAVYVPIDALQSLPRKHFTNGTAEIWKYAFILDSKFYNQLANQPIKQDSNDLPDIVSKCIELKRDVVESDEFETTGIRAILNFGHTVGHAIEQCQEYNGLLHGEAISIGMVVETRIAEELSISTRGLSETIRGHLMSQGLPIDLPEDISIDNLIHAMARDKKSDGNGLAFSFVSNIGECKLNTGISPTDVENILRKL